ncbi:hypothetical protein LXL04_002196 [Taraxacum kok-saghyz]
METLVAIEGSEKSKLEGTSAIVITCSDSSKQIADPVVYKLARVEGDGRLVPATDDEVIEVEDLLDDKSSVHFVLDTCQPAVCSSNHDTFGQEFMPIDCQGFHISTLLLVVTGLLKVKDPCTQGRRSDTAFGTTVDLGKLNSQFEVIFLHQPSCKLLSLLLLSVYIYVYYINQQEISRSESTPIDVHHQIDQSGDRKPSEPSTSSTMCDSSSKPDFSKLMGKICLDNLSVRELHATFKATFGRETSVKDKQWLKRRISMGLSNSCDVSTTTFIIENNRITKKPKVEDPNNNNNENHNHNQNQNENQEDLFGGTNVSENNPSVGQSQSQSQHVEDDNQGGKRVRKPTKRYIEVSETDSPRESSGRSSGHGPRARLRPIHNIQPQPQPLNKPLVTRQDSLGGSGVEIPYVSRIRRGRPRENFMSLMKFQSCGSEVTAKVVKTDVEVEVEDQGMTTGWVQVQQPMIIKEARESEEYSGEGEDSEEGYDSEEDNILTVPTAKGGMRRKHHRPWTLSEVVKLVEGVSRYGAGRWSEIKRIAFSTCSHRTAVDLKDKWRNLLRASFAQLPAEKGLHNSKKQSSIPIPAPILLRVRELAEMHQSQDVKPVRYGGTTNVNSDIKSGFL